MMPSKIEAPMWDHYRVKHEYGKAMEYLSRMLGKLKREEKRWKE